MAFVLRRLMTLVFHPVLWSVPFIALIGINVYQIATVGIFNAELPFYKAFGSFNVILFCGLWLWSAHVLTRRKINRLLVIYLSFVMIFAVYGTGELFARVLWTPRNLSLGNRDPVVWFVSFVYPVFFAFNNVPLLVFFKKDFDTKKKTFLFFLLGVFIMYGLFFLFHSIWLNTPTMPFRTVEWYIGHIFYYIARITSVFGYGLTFLVKEH